MGYQMLDVVCKIPLGSLDGIAAVGYDESDNCRLGGFAVSRYFGDSLSTMTTLLITGVLGFILVTLAIHRRIPLWGRRVLVLSAWGFTACVFAAARDGYYLSVQASTNPGITPGLFSADSAQSVLGSLGGAIIVLCAILCLFIRNQKFRKTFFFVISAIVAAKVLLVELERAGL